LVNAANSRSSAEPVCAIVFITELTN